MKNTAMMPSNIEFLSSLDMGVLGRLDLPNLRSDRSLLGDRHT